MSPLKVRKLLITGGAFQNGKSMEVGKLLDGGYPLEEIERRTGLGRASVYSYIPYRKSAYKTDAIAVSGNAKRIRSFRKGWDERQRMSVMAEASSFPPSGCGEVITDTATGLNVQPWLYGRYHAAAIAATGLACSVPPALEGNDVCGIPSGIFASMCRIWRVFHGASDRRGRCRSLTGRYGRC